MSPPSWGCADGSLVRPASSSIYRTSAIAAYGGFCGVGNGMEAYEGNRSQANELALEASLLVTPIRALMTLRPQWSGTATELLKVLQDQVSEDTKKQQGWPKNAKGLSDRLRRLAPNLRRTGINVLWEKGGDPNRTRTIRLEQVGNCASSASASSSEHPEKVQLADALDATDAQIPLYSNELAEIDLDVG